LIVDGWQSKLNKEIAKQKFIEENTPQILKDFLEDWKTKAIDYYLKAYEHHIDTIKEYKEAERKARIEIINSQSDFEKFRKAEYTDSDLLNPWYLWHKYEKEIEEDGKVKSLKQVLAMQNSVTISKMCEYRNAEERKEWLIKDVEAEKQAKLLDLMYRIIEVTETIKDCKGLRIGNTGLINGIIIGSKANAKIETIDAGGYNVQCYHFRTLVHAIEK